MLTVNKNVVVPIPHLFY